MEGNLHFKIDWASLIVGSKFTVFALFFLSYWIGGLVYGGAYFRNFTVVLKTWPLHVGKISRLTG